VANGLHVGDTRPIAAVDVFPFTKLVATIVANPDKPEPPGHVPTATVGPPVNVILFAWALAVQLQVESPARRSFEICA